MQIIIADCAISQVPKTWIKHRKISQYYHKYGRLPLINGSIHQNFLRDLPQEERNDRPDILHLALLTILGYQTFIPEMDILFQIGVNYYKISPDTRLPRSQNRFYGILEQLLQDGKTNPLVNQTPIANIKLEDAIYFSSKGRSLETLDLNKKTFVFGGYAYGDFKSHSPKHTVSLTSSKLDLWTALSLFLNKKIAV